MHVFSVSLCLFGIGRVITVRKAKPKQQRLDKAIWDLPKTEQVLILNKDEQE